MNMSKILKVISLGLLLSGLYQAVPAYAEDKTADDKKPAEKVDVTKYDSKYNGHQVIPNEMAILCKLNGDVAVGKAEGEINGKKASGATAIKACLEQMILKMNNQDPQTREDGVKEWQAVVQEQLDLTMGEAIAKGAVISNYEKDADTMIYAAKKTKTDHEDTIATASVEAKLTDVINNLRTLYAEEMKYMAISTLSSAPAEFIMKEE